MDTNTISTAPPNYTVDVLATKFGLEASHIYELLHFLLAIGLVEYVGTVKTNGKGPGRKVYRLEPDIGGRVATWFNDRLRTE